MLFVGMVLASGLLFCCGRSVYHHVTTPQSPQDRDPATPTREAGPVSRTPVGMNLADISWASAAYPFVDCMHQADPFWSAGQEWRDERELAVDEHGWPTRLAPDQIARTFVVGGDNPHHPSGTYVARWEGDGELQFQGGVRGVQTGDHRAEIQVQAPDGLWVEIARTNPEDPLRNLEIFLPGGRCESDATQWCDGDSGCEGRCVPFEENAEERPFHPTFMAELAPFGVIRFMDWQRTNRLGSSDEHTPWWPVREWDGYPEPEDAIWAPTPVEVMVDLANQTTTDPWFCIPHLASDDYVRRFAETVKENLDERLQVYVEYTNEYWNDIFAQHQSINAMGCERWSDDPAGECDPDGNGVLCEYTEWNATQEQCLQYGQRYFAVRTAQIGHIFAEVFGEDAPSRLVRVLGMQIGAIEGRGAHMLRQQWRDGEAVHRQVDAVAVAPYFGGGEMTHVQNVDDAFRRISEETHGAPAGTFELISGTADAEWGGIYKWIGDDVATLRTTEEFAHIRLVAYEGGQHFASNQLGPRHELYLAINRDPRIGEVYEQYLQVWAELTGGSTFVHYASPSVWSHFGYWGSKEYQGQPRAEAPKHDAILRYLESLD